MPVQRLACTFAAEPTPEVSHHSLLSKSIVKSRFPSVLLSCTFRRADEGVRGQAGLVVEVVRRCKGWAMPTRGRFTIACPATSVVEPFAIASLRYYAAHIVEIAPLRARAVGCDV